MISSEMNRRALESFIKSGAFDGIETNRHSMMLAVEGILKSVDNDRRKNLEGQVSLFEAPAENGAAQADSYKMPQVPEYAKDVLLQQEKEVSGLFLSGHPLEQYREVISKIATATIGELTGEEGDANDNRRVVLVCTIASIKFFTTKTNDIMAFTTIEDLTGNMEALIFPKVLMEANQVVKENAAVILRGRVSVKEEEQPKIIADEVRSVDDAQPARLRAESDTVSNKGLYLRVPSQDSESFRQAANLLSIFEGDFPVFIRFEDTKKMTRTPSSMWATNNETLVRELKMLLGDENVAVK